MFKVLIVDDEKLERVLISKAVDWQANGLEVIGEAGNGEEALEFFKINEPDLIITDINMPFMDGVTLAEEIRKRSRNCHIIMLTGYREFEYARKAVILGVDEFLVKPINTVEVTKAVIASREKMESERGEQKQIQTLQEEAENTRILLRDTFLQRLLEKRVEKEEAIHKLQMFRLTSLLDDCICVNLSLRLEEHAQLDKKEYYDRMQEWIVLNTTARVCFMHYLNNLILFFAEDTKETVEKQIKQFFLQFQGETGLRIDAGISKSELGFEGIAEAYSQTEKAIAAGMILGGNRYIRYDEYEEIKNRQKNSIDMNWKDFDLAMVSGVRSRVDGCIEHYYRQVTDQEQTDPDYIKIMALEMVSHAATVLSKYGKSILDVMEEKSYYEQVSSIETPADMLLFLKNVVNQILQYTEGFYMKKGTALIANVQKYIHNNLSDPDLSLRLIAKELFVNESYLSRVFKQEKQESLIEYITRNRIEKGLHLMDTTDMKAYEIAEAVGIKDAHYFSICFKKYLGVTIKEYKSGRSK